MGVYLVGMHRSGTSALAAMTSALGAMPVSRLATVSNPAGQWERADLRPALELLLACNRATWDRPPPEARTLRCPPPLGRHLRRAFETAGTEPFLWKDPRLCSTIDHWLALPQPEPTVLFVHREPLAVARSLRRRNGWPLERGLALWERTTRNAIVRLGRHPVHAVPHHRLATDPAAVAADGATWLDVGADPARTARAVELAIAHRTAAASSGGPTGTDPSAERSRLDRQPTVEPTPAQRRLAERIAPTEGRAVLDLDGVGPESPTTADLLGRPHPAELVRRTVRALNFTAPYFHDGFAPDHPRGRRLEDPDPAGQPMPNAPT